ncbi:MerR family transcriptional regulator [Chitinimonas sp. BJYL2]|uniref:MerR family transcriptional regulator n=1 Tax=Chitinimonas sp. BJYL2 TaxID=2976696 RepID=UPI0022B3ABA9|nr:MerR family transcriptional regulator [Chitinimonas sp. BJYL2]
MRIGELASASGLSRDSLRFYEQQGLIAARRRDNGYREYAPDTVQYLLYIKTAQKLGFSLAEIGENLLALRQADDQAAAIAALLRSKLAVVEAKMAELAALRADLQIRLNQACPLLPVR